MTPLERISERVARLGHPDEADTPRPLVTVEEFFNGNSEVGCIGCNLETAPSPDQFYKLFQEIARRPEVKDIRVQITAFDLPEWPFTDTVYIMTSAPPVVVVTWFSEELKPDETWEGFVDQPFEPYEVPTDCMPVACWWD